MEQSLGAMVVFDLGFNSQYQRPADQGRRSRLGWVYRMSCGHRGSRRHVFHRSVGSGDVHPRNRRPVRTDRAQRTGVREGSRTKVLLCLIGAKHVQFGTRWEPIAAQATIDFFNRYLKHDDDALRQLAADANVPNVASLQQAPG